MKFLKKYSHAWTLLYVFIYMPWFMWLEKSVTAYHAVHIRLDDMIPFCEYFIIPYLLWFLYVPIVLLYEFFTSKRGFYKASAFLFIGMSICLLICTVWPNGQELRLNITGNNIFCSIVRELYKSDTNTNVFPSIHVFNSVGIMIAVFKSDRLKKSMIVKGSAFLLTVSIILSTVFLKQHSVLDVVGGILLSVIMYVLVYIVDYSKIFGVIEDKKIDKKGYLEGENI